MTDPATSAIQGISRQDAEQLARMRKEFASFMMEYKFAIDEILTKISILREEFTLSHDYNPIEHVTHRVKSADSLIDKLIRRNVPLDFAEIRGVIRDIAGIRITCSFLSDVDRIKELISTQADIQVVEEKDYIRSPKPNGYQSLHLIVEVPVFLSKGATHVPVELQIRTIAMDFWASLEHKIYYKYNGEIPREMEASLKLAADTALQLDTTMERMHEQVRDLKAQSRIESQAQDHRERFEAMLNLLDGRWQNSPL